MANFIYFFTGTISRENIGSFQRDCSRATHGNCIVKFSHVNERLIDPVSSEDMDECDFMVFFSKEV